MYGHLDSYLESLIGVPIKRIEANAGADAFGGHAGVAGSAYPDPLVALVRKSLADIA